MHVATTVMMEQAAIEIAGHGLYVVPVYAPKPDGSCTCHEGANCANPGKHPRGNGWHGAATTDPSVISRTWANYPDGNIGVLWGSLSNAVDIEFDDDEGRKTAAEIFGEGCFTPTYRSSRSVHRIFRHDHRLPKGATQKHRGLEFRLGIDKAAQSVVPPSRHYTGAQYEWLPGLSLDDVEIQPLPEVLIEMAHRATKKSPEVSGHAENVRSYEAGGRNNALARLAGSLRRRGLQQVEILATLRAVNQSRCVPPLEASEVVKIAESICRYDPGSDADWTMAPRSPIEKFSLRTLQDEYQQLHPILIDGLLRAGETGNIIAGSKVGKSWLVYYLLLCFATGRPIFEKFATDGGKALLIDNELHKPTIANRIKTVANAMGIQRDEYVDRIDVWPLRGNLRSIFELAAEFGPESKGQYDLIILDAKYRALGQDSDENSNSDETRFYNAVDQLAMTAGAAFLQVHHSSKGLQSDKRVTDVGAGAGAQSRAADLHLILREHEDPDCVVLDAAVRSFAPVQPLGLRWSFPLWEPDNTLDVEELKGRKSAADEKQDRKDAEAQGLVLDHAQGWQTRTYLKTETGLGYGRLDRAIAVLINDGYLESREQPREGKRGPAKVKQFRNTIRARKGPGQ